MQAKNPFNVWILEADEYIRKNNIKEVTSPYIYQPSSTLLHPEGLFSEEIFGQIASVERYFRPGYIALNTKVFHPKLYLELIGLKKFYEDILTGTAYARYDIDERDFVQCEKDDPDGGTGFSFFIRYFDRLELKETGSLKTSVKIDLFKKYKDRIFISNFLVTPAGIRDIRVDEAGVTTERVNKLYWSLLADSRAFPKGAEDLPVADPIRYQIQKRVVEIYLYIIKDVVSGKKGFGQGKYAARAVAYGTRDVISSALMSAPDPRDPKFLKHDEAAVPLFLAMKAFEPIVKYQVNHIFLQHVFTASSGNVALIDEKYNLSYVEISERERTKFDTSDGLSDIINRFKLTHERFYPMQIKDINNKYHYLYLIYEEPEKNKIYFLRNIEDFKTHYEANSELKFDIKNIRPMTYADMFYIATFIATMNKHGQITRYPVTDSESVYYAKVHLMSTTPSRTVSLSTNLDPNLSLLLPEYPIVGMKFQDSLALHASRLSNLGADMDGDMVSFNSAMCEDVNAEISKFLSSPLSMVKPNGDLVVGAGTDLIKYMFFNMSATKQDFQL